MEDSQAEVRETGYTLTFTDVALKDLYVHEKAGNQATIKRIKRILEELKTTPYVGIGDPHALIGNYAGRWSRHISKKDVMIFEVDEIERMVLIHAARFHYLDK